MNSNNNQLTWRHLKALNDLYSSGSTKAKIDQHSYIKFLISKRHIAYKIGNHSILEAKESFKELYESKFKEDFKYFEDFFNSSRLPTDGRGRYSEDDIETLVFIKDNKKELLSALTTERTFSSNVFKTKGSKYLERKPGLKNAVCRLLEIQDFPDKDPKNNQMRLVVDCPNPEVIVLCENMNNLKAPWEKRKHNIELWYVGGNNIGIIDEIPSKYFNLPIYYLCDWDYDGLKIYSRVKSKMQQKNVSINLIDPDDAKVALPVNSENHYSEWLKNNELSGLELSDFNEEQKKVITYLIEKNLWIEEESLDLIKLLKNMNIIN